MCFYLTFVLLKQDTLLVPLTGHFTLEVLWNVQGTILQKCHHRPVFPMSLGCCFFTFVWLFLNELCAMVYTVANVFWVFNVVASEPQVSRPWIQLFSLSLSFFHPLGGICPDTYKTPKQHNMKVHSCLLRKRKTKVVVSLALKTLKAS